MKATKRKLYILYTILGISLLANVITLSLDVIPRIYPVVKSRYFKEKTIKKIDSSVERIVFDAALKMAKSSKVTMVWDEPKGVTNSLLNSKSIASTNEFRKYNYPRAYLYYGLSNFLLRDKKNQKRESFKHLFDESLIDERGNPRFDINRVDQVPFGMAALNLYKMYGKKKYLTFSHELYQYTVNSIDDVEGIVLYRREQPTVLNDVLGMVVPFLVEYAKITGSEEPLEIAKRQLEYYINYGVDKETYLPAHAINRKHLVKVGSANWGRGIGWYYIALSSFYKETGLFEEEYKGLTQTLLSLKNSDGLWSQFPGSSEPFDASSTTLFLYAMMLNPPLHTLTTYTHKPSKGYSETLQNLTNYISQEGVILHTSGDTYATNRYSSAFGKSELSQGMLLLIFSLLDK